MSYYEEARRRAQRRRSPWNLLLIPAVGLPAGLLWWAFAKGLEAIHGVLYPGETLKTAPNAVGAIFTAVSPFFAALPIAMLVGNVLVQLIPPARRVLDREAAPYPGTGFHKAQKQLLQFSKYLVPIGVAVGLLGALIPWGP
jgi:hypothetical protein